MKEIYKVNEPNNDEKEQDIKSKAERFTADTKALKTNLAISNAWILTCRSCCLFAPCTIPYIVYKKMEQRKNKFSDVTQPDSLSMRK